MSKAEAGPWSTCGSLQVEKVALASDHLEIDGKRVILALRSHTAGGRQGADHLDPKITPVIKGDRIRIVVEMLDVARLRQTMAQVFQGGSLLFPYV